MSESKSSASSGIGVLGLLGVAFVVLKLCGVIDWSWWYVTLPFWGGLAVVLGIFLIIGLVAAIAAAFESKQDRATRKAADSLRSLSKRLSR